MSTSSLLYLLLLNYYASIHCKRILHIFFNKLYLVFNSQFEGFLCFTGKYKNTSTVAITVSQPIMITNIVRFISEWTPLFAFIWCSELFFFSFNNCSLWSSDLQRGVQRGLDGPSAAGPAALLSHWSDASLGRFTGATRLCPGKMALDEQQCSAPPRWRSISLTHVEFPEGM